MKLIIYPDVDIWEFVLSGLMLRSDIMRFPLNRHSNIIQKVSRKYGSTIPLPIHFVLSSCLQNAIKGLKQGDAIIIAEYTDPALVLAISKIIPDGVSRYIWLWNHKGDDKYFSNNLPAIKNNCFQVITYDELDAEKFWFRWHTQFFNIQPYLQASFLNDYTILYDFFFVGFAKNREEEIDVIHSMLSSYTCKFVTVHSNSEYIPYARYMEMALQSRCLVEIVHTGDTSCTLRPLEALALHRKLLTNNSAVRNYSFYCPQNIFILGEDDIENLPEFLDRPFFDLPMDLVNSYDVNAWINIFQ